MSGQRRALTGCSRTAAAGGAFGKSESRGGHPRLPLHDDNSSRARVTIAVISEVGPGSGIIGFVPLRTVGRAVGARLAVGYGAADHGSGCQAADHGGAVPVVAAAIMPMTPAIPSLPPTCAVAPTGAAVAILYRLNIGRVSFQFRHRPRAAPPRLPEATLPMSLQPARPRKSSWKTAFECSFSLSSNRGGNQGVAPAFP